ncbi:hypothetical protein D3C85_1215860 [compost metagenome]
MYKSSNTGKILPGDIRFADLNGDGVINNGSNTVNDPGDRKIIGNSTPRYTYGISLGADWSGFFFSTFFQGVGKMDWYPGSENGTFWGQYNRPYNKVPKSQMGNIWTPENPDAYFPRYRGYIAQNGSATLTQVQTKYLQNAAYIRMKNLQIGYNVPPAFIKRIGLSNLKVFFTGENLWSWSPLYKITRDLDVENIGKSDRVLETDPDRSSGNGNNYPILKSFSLGLSATF